MKTILPSMQMSVASPRLLSPDFCMRLVYKQTRHYQLSSDERDDCAVAFFLHLLQHSPIPTSAQNAAYLNRCAANFVSNYCRNQNRLQRHEVAWPQQTQVDGDATDGEFADSVPAPSKCLIQEEVRERILTAMQYLTPEQHACIHRYFFHEESYAEIAAQTNRSSDSVRMCISRGLRRLRTLLQEQGMTEAEACEYLTEIGSLITNIRGGRKSLKFCKEVNFTRSLLTVSGVLYSSSVE